MMDWRELAHKMHGPGFGPQHFKKRAGHKTPEEGFSGEGSCCAVLGQHSLTCRVGVVAQRGHRGSPE